MSNIPASQASEKLRQLRDRAQRIVGMSAAIQSEIMGIMGGLQHLAANGIAPERMPSTIMLGNEYTRTHTQQHARIQSLMTGIEEMI